MLIIWLYQRPPLTVHWLAEVKLTQRVVNSIPETTGIPPLETLSSAWEQPIFSVDRAPDTAVIEVNEEGPGDLVLKGTVITKESKIALITDGENGIYRLHVGEKLPSGWVLESLSEVSATFSANEQKTTLSLLRPHLPQPDTAAQQKLPQEAVHFEHQQQ